MRGRAVLTSGWFLSIWSGLPNSIWLAILRTVPQTGGLVRVLAEPNFDALRLRLSVLRAERELTYEQLAERSGVSRATLIAMETGSPRSRRPEQPASRGSLESWWRIAHALDVDLGDLLASLDEPA
ncbi:helix-turn-helix transcriptional regulator [Agromyces mediolanus]|uniref:HTH cro/C1-type domain-containing protein n=2 Tax=Agromyces mediolanus TaxID=41986 RepID=A0A918FD66_AGRME|nr:hypothetical protein GCM10010196_23520 [Agromyces mediolanus]GLJ72148.1 hypothetical protein GCM10017583_14040 [Agromyces mediolanus]